MQIIRTAQRAVDELGGNTAIADDIGIRPSAVGNWKVRGLPARRFVYLNQRAARLGFALDPALFPEMQAGNGKTR